MRFATLIRRDLARQRKRLIPIVCAVALGVFVLIVLGGVLVGAYTKVVRPMLPRLPLDLIKVEPKVLSLGFIAFDSQKLTGGGLDDDAVARLEQIDGVDRVFPVVGASFPVRAEGGAGFLGHRIRTDLFLTGVSPDLVAGDVAKGYSFSDPGPTAQVVPVLAARRLLDLYNSTVAQAINKPRLSADAVMGFSFDLVLGSSYVRGTPDANKVRTVTAQIVGLSDQASMVGVTVPEPVLRRWNQEFGGSSPVVSAYVKAKSREDAARITAAVEGLGLTVDETMKVAGTVLVGGGLFVGMFVWILLAAIVFAIAQAFFLMVRERASELAVLRAIGASRSDLVSLVLLEAFVVGLCGALVGLVSGVGAALALDRLLIEKLPRLPFVPDSLVALSPTLLSLAFALGVLAAVGGAFAPAVLGARSDPVRVLRQ